MKEFFTDNATIVQATGAGIALIVSLVALFNKDTIKKNTKQLTGYGWFCLITILMGAAVGVVSKYYEYEENKESNKKKDKLLLQQASLLSQMKTQQDGLLNELEEMATLNDPIWPLSINYSLATDLSDEGFDEIVDKLKSTNIDITSLNDAQIRKVITSSNNEVLNDLIYIDNKPICNRVMFSSNDTSNAVYFCKTSFNQLRIQQYDNKYYLIDSIGFNANPPVSETRRLTKLKNLDLQIHRNYASKIPDKYIPTLWSDIQLHFSKKDPFAVGKGRVFARNYTEPNGFSNLIYTLKDWDYKNPFEFN
jgi:hypothetical protein